MARPLTTLVVFFFAMNLFAGVLVSTGVAGVIGIDAQVGEDDKFDQEINQRENVSTGTEGGGTLFPMYNVLGDQLGGLYDTIYPGLNMMERAGVPDYITDDILGNLFSILTFIGIVSFIRGWGL
jgi:hypothetical protein